MCGGWDMRGLIPSSSPEHQCQKKKFPTTFGCENKETLRSLETPEGCWKPRCAFIGSAHIQVYSLIDAHPKLPWRDSKSKDTRNIWRETELCGFSIRAGEAAATVPVLSPIPTQPVSTGSHHSSCAEPSPYIHCRCRWVPNLNLHYPGHTVHLTLETPRDPAHANLWTVQASYCSYSSQANGLGLYCTFS